MAYKDDAANDEWDNTVYRHGDEPTSNTS